MERRSCPRLVFLCLRLSSTHTGRVHQILLIPPVSAALNYSNALRPAFCQTSPGSLFSSSTSRDCPRPRSNKARGTSKVRKPPSTGRKVTCVLAPPIHAPKIGFSLADYFHRYRTPLPSALVPRALCRTPSQALDLPPAPVHTPQIHTPRLAFLAPACTWFAGDFLPLCPS